VSVVVRFKPTGLTREQYDESIKRLEEVGHWPNTDGMQLHVLFGDDGDLHVSEIWDSREQLQAFGEILVPILTDIGIQFSGEPEIFEVHNLTSR
jgi:hypothetical protein